MSISTSTAPFSFHCTICFERFNLTDRPPVILPCGHTYICAPCSKRLKRCMECRTSLYITPPTPQLPLHHSPIKGPPSPVPLRHRSVSYGSPRGGGGGAGGAAGTTAATRRYSGGHLYGGSQQQQQQQQQHGHHLNNKPEPIALPLPKNLVMMSLMEAAEREAEAKKQYERKMKKFITKKSLLQASSTGVVNSAGAAAAENGNGDGGSGPAAATRKATGGVNTKDDEEATERESGGAQAEEEKINEDGDEAGEEETDDDNNDDDDGYESGDDDEQVLKGIETLAGSAGTYIVREKYGLFVFPGTPRRLSGQFSFNEDEEDNEGGEGGNDTKKENDVASNGSEGGMLKKSDIDDSCNDEEKKQKVEESKVPGNDGDEKMKRESITEEDDLVLSDGDAEDELVGDELLMSESTDKIDNKDHEESRSPSKDDDQAKASVVSSDATLDVSIGTEKENNFSTSPDDGKGVDHSVFPEKKGRVEESPPSNNNNASVDSGASCSRNVENNVAPSSAKLNDDPPSGNKDSKDDKDVRAAHIREKVSSAMASPTSIKSLFEDENSEEGDTECGSAKNNSTEMDNQQSGDSDDVNMAVRPSSSKNQPYKIEYGEKVQVVNIRGGVVKLARGRGYIVASSSQLVKVGAPEDKACQIEGMLSSLSVKKRELLIKLMEIEKVELGLEKNLREALLAEEDTEQGEDKKSAAQKSPSFEEDMGQTSNPGPEAPSITNSSSNAPAQQDRAHTPPNALISHAAPSTPESPPRIRSPPVIPSSIERTPRGLGRQVAFSDRVEYSPSVGPGTTDTVEVSGGDLSPLMMPSSFSSDREGSTSRGRIGGAVGQQQSHFITELLGCPIPQGPLGCVDLLGHTFLYDDDDDDEAVRILDMAREMAYQEVRNGPRPESSSSSSVTGGGESRNSVRPNFRTGLSGHLALTSANAHTSRSPSSRQVRMMSDHKGIAAIRPIRRSADENKSSPNFSHKAAPNLSTKTW